MLLFHSVALAELFDSDPLPSSSSCASSAALVEFEIPFREEGYVLDKSRTRALFGSSDLLRRSYQQAQRDFFAAAAASDDPVEVFNRLSWFLTHREVAFFIRRWGLFPETEPKSLEQLAQTLNKSIPSLRSMETHNLESLAAAAKVVHVLDASVGRVSIKKLSLTVETQHTLFLEGIFSVEQLSAISLPELKLMKRFGPTRVREVTEALDRYRRSGGPGA